MVELNLNDLARETEKLCSHRCTVRFDVRYSLGGGDEVVRTFDDAAAAMSYAQELQSSHQFQWGEYWRVVTVIEQVRWMGPPAID